MLRQRTATSSRGWLLGVAIVLVFALTPITANAAQAPIPLGSAGKFAVLAGAGITNTGATSIVGDVGTFPTPSEVGFGACPAAGCVNLTGVNHHDDPVTQAAKGALSTAYGDATSRTPAATIPDDLGGQTLSPGLYDSASGSFGMVGAGIVTLDAGGDSNAVFIFQMASTLVTGSSSNVRLIGGAQPCNVFWQVGSSATLGTDSTFRGTILAETSVTVTTNVAVFGRILAKTGAVTLDTDSITRSGCSASTYRPDAQVKGGPADSVYLGKDVYNTTGRWQTKHRYVKPGHVDRFNIKLENDGTATDTFTVEGDRSSSMFTVSYFADDTDITSAVVSGAYDTGKITPGSSTFIAVQIETSPKARLGSMKKVLVTATSQGDASLRDTVGAEATVQEMAGDIGGQSPSIFG